MEDLPSKDYFTFPIHLLTKFFDSSEITGLFKDIMQV